MVTATVASTRLLPRVGPGPLVPTGLAVAAVGIGYLTGIDAGSSYAGAVLPGIMASGIGFGMIMAPSFATATHGVAAGDAGVASALVNTSQQVGGSLGVALLSTVFAERGERLRPGRGHTVALSPRPRRRCTAPPSCSGGRPPSSPRARSSPRCCSSAAASGARAGTEGGTLSEARPAKPGGPLDFAYGVVVESVNVSVLA